MTGRLGPGSWGVQQLAGFLASLATDTDTSAIHRSAAQRLAEALEAEVCAIVSGGALAAVVGFPAADVPEGELLAAAAGDVTSLDVPGVGAVPVTVVDGPAGTDRVVVVGRRAEPLDAGERHLVRAMAQVLELTLQLHGTADRERGLRRAVERQADELREVNERLTAALRVKRDLVSMTSHELRTPLVAMLGFASLLKDGWEEFEDAERDQYLTILERHGRRMLRLVDDLLTVGRLEDDRVPTRRVETSLSAAVAEIVRDLGGADLELETTTADDRVYVDVDHLSQILANLIENARKYGEPPIEVTVSATADWRGVDVTDAGDGVPEEFVPALFERFTQASRGMRRDSTGVGLGLAIVAGLAGRNDGWVVYDRVDGRTRFSVRFPRPGDRRDPV